MKKGRNAITIIKVVNIGKHPNALKRKNWRKQRGWNLCKSTNIEWSGIDIVESLVWVAKKSIHLWCCSLWAGGINGMKSIQQMHVCLYVCVFLCYRIMPYILNKFYIEQQENMMSVAWYRHTPRSMPNTWPRPRNATISCNICGYLLTIE